MPESRAEELHQQFAEAFNSGRIEPVLALYEPGATLAGSPSDRDAKGLAAIRETFERLLNLHWKMAIETRYCLQAGELALLSGKWHLTGKGPDGKPIDREGQSIEVVRRQPDGRWLYLIDHPFGAD
jgi:ketosteroid isomerase-like protein